MVYSTSLSPSIQTIQEETLSRLKSEIAKNSRYLKRQILVIGENTDGFADSIPASKDFEIISVPNVHFALRSGIFQDFSFFALADDYPHVNASDLKQLLNTRLGKPFETFTLSQLKELDLIILNEKFRNVETDTRILHAVRDSLHQKNSTFSAPHYVQRTEKIDGKGSLENRLFQFLKSSIQANKDFPEETLKGAINIIRPPKK